MRQTHLLSLALALVSTFAQAEDPIKSMPSFPISLNAKEVREFPKLSVEFRSVMLRFNPEDANAIIKPSAGKTIVDKGAAEMARHLLASTFRHCYHRGQDALVPAKDAIAVDLYSQEHGNLLISADKKVGFVYNFTERAEVYAKK